MSWPMTNNELREYIEQKIKIARSVMLDASFHAEETNLPRDCEPEIHRIIARLDLLLELMKHD
jgi:hypothetical protein